MFIKFLSWCCRIDIPELLAQNVLLRKENEELRKQLNIKANSNITFTSTPPYIEYLQKSYEEIVNNVPNCPKCNMQSQYIEDSGYNLCFCKNCTFIFKCKN